jgi:hypothetical protein
LALRQLIGVYASATSLALSSLGIDFQHSIHPASLTLSAASASAFALASAAGLAFRDIGIGFRFGICSKFGFCNGWHPLSFWHLQ